MFLSGSVIRELVLWDGPLGKTVGCGQSNLFKDVIASAYTSKTHFARLMRTAAIKYGDLPTEILPQHDQGYCRTWKSAIFTSRFPVMVEKGTVMVAKVWGLLLWKFAIRRQGDVTG